MLNQRFFATTEFIRASRIEKTFTRPSFVLHIHFIYRNVQNNVIGEQCRLGPRKAAIIIGSEQTLFRFAPPHVSTVVDTTYESFLAPTRIAVSFTFTQLSLPLRA